MKKNNKFVARLGRNNTIRIFEAATGRLMREILVSGKVCDNPVCVEAKVSVEIISEGRSIRQSITYLMVVCSLKSLYNHLIKHI